MPISADSLGQTIEATARQILSASPDPVVRFRLLRAVLDSNVFLPPFEPKALGKGRYEFSAVGSGPWLLKVTAAGYVPHIEFFNNGPGDRLDVKLQKQPFLWDGREWPLP